MPNLTLEFINKGDEIAAYYESRDYNRAMKSIMELADQANQMIDAEKPWLLIKNSDSIQRAHEVCSLGLNLFRILMIYLKPVLPITAGKTEKFLNIPAMTWGQRQNTLVDHTINTFEPLLQRIPEEIIQNMQKTDSIATN